MKICPQCKHDNPSAAQYCMFCGVSLDDEENLTGKDPLKQGLDEANSSIALLKQTVSDLQSQLNAHSNAKTGPESISVPPPPPPPVIEYRLTTATYGNGSISLSAQTEKEGKTIYIYDTPEDGYELSELFYSSPKGEHSLGTKHTFVMPNSDVKVRAVFVKKESSGKDWKIVLGVISWAAAIAVLVTMLNGC